MFTYQVHLWNKDMLQQYKETNKRTRKKKTTENPREGEESDFQICHIRFKCQVFKKKNHKAHKEKGKNGQFKEKYKSTETVPEKNLDDRLNRKRHKMTILKILKELN